MKKPLTKHFFLMISPIVALIVFLLLATSCGTKKTTTSKKEEKVVSKIEAKSIEKQKVDFDVQLLEKIKSESFTLVPKDNTRPAKAYQKGDTLIVENAEATFNNIEKDRKLKNNSQVDNSKETDIDFNQDKKIDEKDKEKENSGTKNTFWWWIAGIIIALFVVYKLFK